MRYVVMLTGNNRMAINDFFTYMDMSLECINTSSRYEDIINHLKYITPDVFVYCLYGESPDDIKRFANVEHKFTEQDIPIVIVGNRDECEQFSKIAPSIEVTVFQRPISAQKLEHQIVEMLEKGEQGRSLLCKRISVTRRIYSLSMGRWGARNPLPHSRSPARPGSISSSWTMTAVF